MNLSMGLFFKKKRNTDDIVPSIPSLEEQRQMAKTSVNSFLDQVTKGWNLDEEGDCECAYFKIAGITNYCNYTDVGMVRGLTFKDKENPYDKTAIGIMDISNKGKRLLGYIAKGEDKKEYKKFSEEVDYIPYIGYIRKFTDSQGKSGICGTIKLYKGVFGRIMYDKMVADTQTLLGAFNGYYNNTLFKDSGEKLEWVLERHF